MKTIEADLKVLAEIKYAGKVYHLREIDFGTILDMKDREDQQEATFDLFEIAGVPKQVSKSLSPRVLKEIEDILIGELKTEKK